MKRFQTKAPYHYGDYQLRNGDLRQTKIIYYLHAIIDNDDEILEYMTQPQGSFLHGFLRAIGPYCRLWVGDLDGIVAPKDVPPQGWTYPNGEPVEDSWFWDWYPSETSVKKLMAEMHKSNPLEAGVRLKALVPFQLNRKHGVVTGVEAIPVMRLPDLFTKCEWTFEVDQL